MSPLTLKPLYKHIAKLWNTFTGDSDSFDIEARIFHAIVIIATVLLTINGLTTCIIGMSAESVYAFAFIPVLWLMYYLSRYKGKPGLSIIILGAFGNAECIGVYFLTGGSNGDNLLMLTAITFILLAVAPKKQLKVWIPLNCAILVGLIFAEYLHPEWVTPLYDDSATRLMDQAQSYLIFFVLLVIIIMLIKSNYYTEKRLADLRELELIKSNEAKNKLFSIVAHDLRAPLASVQNYLELLKQVYLTEEEKSHIQENLLNSTKHTSEMLTNILSWSKAQMDGMSLNFVKVNLERSLNPTVALQQHMAKEKGIELICPEPSEMVVTADPDMLQLVVRNIISNAIKFTPAGGKISVSYEERDKECCIIISDNGIGIAKENHEQVFSLKSQSTYGTNNEKGVGLGLVLSKNYVELQNGKIWFESEEGSGTTFFLSFGLN